MGGWAELKRVLRNGNLRARPLLVGLDFDGTLAPLALRPGRARLSRGTRGLLSRLAAKRSVRLAVLSGRGLADVKARVGLRRVTCAGNHGLEIEGPGVRWSHPGALAARSAAQGAARALERRLRDFPGAELENKGLTLSVHYRLVPAAARPGLRRLLLRAVGPHAGRLELAPGKQVREVRPRVRWNKGHALLKIARLMGGGPGLLFVGDDRTDEEGFRVLGRRAVTVRVGSAARSAARFLLRRRERVEDLLRLLCGRP